MLRTYCFALASLLAAPAFAQSCLFFNNAPPGTSLGLTDDSTRVIALPFPFNFNGVNHTVITVSSNGFVWFGINTNNDLSDSEAELLAQGPRVALNWEDWNPSSTALQPGGGIFYNQTATQASIVWKGVPRFNSTTIFANMELVLSITGEIDFYFDAAHGVPNSTSITGISRGNGAPASPLDLSALPSSATPVIVGATGYELFPTNVFDLAGTTMCLVPTSLTDYVAVSHVLQNCPPNTPPTLPTYPLATGSSFGAGCPAPTTGTWYETFPTGSIDLSNTSWLFNVTGTDSYVVTAGSGFDNSFAPADALVQGDDSQVTVSTSAMGGFPFKGATVNSVAACSNGFLWMVANASNSFTATAADFASNSPRLAPCWADWNFSQGGVGLSGTFYWTQNANFCMATWQNVAAFGMAGTQNTFQCKLYPNGNIEFWYGTILNNATTNTGIALVGLSGGASTPLAPVDISANTMPLVNILSATAAPMVHTTTLPKLGTTWGLTTSVAPAGSLLGATLIGFVQTNLPLAPAAPGCFQYVNSLATTLNILGGAVTWTNSIPIPVDLSYVGITFISQGVAFVPGLNPLNVATSNGRISTIGL